MVWMDGWRLGLLCGLCFVVGGIPLTGLIVKGLTGQRLSEVGTGNVSVSAAFYHAGKTVGILTALAEAAKGVGAVLLARLLLPGAGWELVAIIFLVLGRNLFGGGAGTTNAFWGYLAHDWQMALVMVGGSALSFGLLRRRLRSQHLVLGLLPLVVALRYPTDRFRMLATMVLCLLFAIILQRVPDDMELPTSKGHAQSNRVLRWLQPDRQLLPLTQPLDPQRVGNKAATLSQLHRWGYSVPSGWVLPVQGDVQAVLKQVQPAAEQPLVVRSSAVGEDAEQASAAGQYQSVLQVTTLAELERAIATTLASYDSESARAYRCDRNLPEAAMAVIIQHQIRGQYSGVAFSRDPVTCQGEAVLVEALPGDATQVVSGRVTPEQYRLDISEQSPSADCPPIIYKVAKLARQLEEHYHGIPQDIEWTYDGQTLWLLQARPITTLLPLWTRKIAAEVIPGTIRPLTWSVNQPLTCGVWGDIFTIVLGNQAQDLDFGQTATLHYGHAYFNASLLGEIFLRMGLPPNSLEFLTRGAKFSRPPLRSTLKNIPGLLRLVGRERRLIRDWQQEDRQHFRPALTHLAQQPATALSAPAILERIETLLSLLQRTTYYSILAPLSLAARQALFKVEPQQLNQQALPEVASVQDIRELAAAARPLLQEPLTDRQTLWHYLAAHPDGPAILHQLDDIIERYGYLSEVGTDIAVDTWQENPRPVQELFTQFCLHPPKAPVVAPTTQNWKTRQVQARLNLKGQVTRVYSQFLAYLRWSLIALAQQWQAATWLAEPSDIFFLELDEIRSQVRSPQDFQPLQVKIQARKQAWQAAGALQPVPFLIYGNHPPALAPSRQTTIAPERYLQGIGVSAGQVEGPVKVMHSLQQDWSDLTANTILVVPYTDSGWAPLLARAAGLIADVGGRLSHGAIVAREYGIPAVMDIHQATQQLKDGQIVRIDGQRGTVERV